VTDQGELLEICLEAMEREGLTVEECLARHGDAARPLVPLLETAVRFRSAPAVEPSRAFRAAARTRMLNLIATSSHPAPARTRIGLKVPAWLGDRPWYLLARVAAVLAVAVALLGGSLNVVAAATPDSLLYPARLALEEGRVALALSDAERSRLRMDMAERRTADLAWLVGRDSPALLQTVAGLTEINLLQAVESSERAGNQSMAEVEARLAQPERQLREILESRASSTEEQAVLMRTLAFMEREREQLRERRGAREPGSEPEDAAWPSGGAGYRADPTSTPGSARGVSRDSAGPAETTAAPGDSREGSDAGGGPAGSPAAGSTMDSGLTAAQEAGAGSGTGAGAGAAGYTGGHATNAGSGPSDAAPGDQPGGATATSATEQSWEEPRAILPTATLATDNGAGPGAPSGPSDGRGQAGPSGETTPSGPAASATAEPAGSPPAPTSTPAVQPSGSPVPALGSTATAATAPTQESTATPQPTTGERGTPTPDPASTGGPVGGASGAGGAPGSGGSSGSGGGGRR